MKLGKYPLIIFKPLPFVLVHCEVCPCKLWSSGLLSPPVLLWYLISLLELNPASKLNTLLPKTKMAFLNLLLSYYGHWLSCDRWGSRNLAMTFKKWSQREETRSFFLLVSCWLECKCRLSSSCHDGCNCRLHNKEDRARKRKLFGNS